MKMEFHKCALRTTTFLRFKIRSDWIEKKLQGQDRNSTTRSSNEAMHRVHRHEEIALKSEMIIASHLHKM